MYIYKYCAPPPKKILGTFRHSSIDIFVIQIFEYLHNYNIIVTLVCIPKNSKYVIKYLTSDFFHICNLYRTADIMVQKCIAD